MNSREDKEIGESGAGRPVNLQRPIVRDSLSDEQSESLRTIYSVLSEFLLPTFEQFERDFLREEKIDDRIARWAFIANGFHEFQKNHPDAEGSERKLAMSCLTMLAYGGPRPKSAPDELWIELRSYMRPLIGP